MRTYLVPVLIEVEDEVFDGWGARCDQIFALAGMIFPEGNTGNGYTMHMLHYEPVPNGSVDKYQLFTPEGGI